MMPNKISIVLVIACSLLAHSCTEAPEQVQTPSASPSQIDVRDIAAIDHWPSFRGQQASGVNRGEGLPDRWDAPAGNNIGWRTAIPGLGHSSPVIWGERLFVTTAVGSEETPYLRIGLYGSSPDNPEKEDHDYRLYCLDRTSGEILWQQTAVRAIPKVQRHVKASHANCTPATDGRHVAAFFGSQGLYVYTVEGELVWHKDLGYLDAGAFDAPEIQWGFGSSPVIAGNRMVVLCDVNNQSFIAAFDIATGDELWRTERDEVPTWGTPTIVEHKGRTQVIVNGYKHLGAYDLETGEPIWWMKGGGDIPVPTPIVAHGLVFFTNSHGPSRPIIAVRLDAVGDISLAEGERSNEGVAWSIPRRGAYMPTPIVVGDELYVLADSGILACYDARTGKEHYRERVGGERGAYTASPVAADGRIFCTEEHGTVHMVRLGSSYEYLGSCPLGAAALASPAIIDDMMYIRTNREVLGIKAGGKTAPSQPQAAEPTPTAAPRIPIPTTTVTDPVQVLRIANQEAEKVTSVRFHVTARAEEAAAAMMGAVDGSIAATGDGGSLPKKFIFEGSVQWPGEAEARRITAGSDGDRYWLIDHQSKTAHVDFEAGVLGRYAQSVLYALFTEFHLQSPFGAEIEATKHELREAIEVGGEPCHQVYLQYRPEPLAEVVWTFSKTDFLPRSRQDRFALQDGAIGVVQKTISDLEVDPEIDDRLFRFTLPEGFERLETPAG